MTLRFDRLDAMKMAALVTFALAVVTTGCGSSSPTQVNVSRWPLPQNEVSAAIDPNKPDVLLVGSNSLQEGQTRSYTSTDGGATWTTELAPPLATGFSEVDPAVAIDASGREYFASLQTRRRSDGLADHQLFASTRSGPGGEWGAPVAVDQPFGLAPLAIDDKDAIAVDGTRVYLTWSRFLNWTNPKHNRYSIMLARTTNGGRSWSTPVAVTTTTKTINLIYASVGARGKNVYVAWEQGPGVGDLRVRVARSRDGGRHFGQPTVVSDRACRANGWRLAGAPETGAPPAPQLVVDADGIAITYGSFDCRNRPEIHVAILDRQLRRLRDTTLGEGFLAVPAYDRGTDTLWVCWYATTDKVHMRYSCTPSHDSGRSFEKPRAAASVDSDETGPLAAHGYGGREYGDYEGLAVSHGVAHAFWTDSRDLAELGEEVYTTTLREW